jgi:hypothetical protein
MSTLLLGKGFIALEVIGLGGGFFIFHKLNTDVEARRKMHVTAPFVIEAFGKATGKTVSELLGQEEGVIMNMPNPMATGSDEGKLPACPLVTEDRQSKEEVKENKILDERLRTFGAPPLTTQEEALKQRLEALRQSERELSLDSKTAATVAQEKRRIKEALSALR